MAIFYALNAQPFETHYFTLGDTVPEDRWRELVQRATAAHKLPRDSAHYLSEKVAPRVPTGRAIAGSGGASNDAGAILYWAMLADCKAAEWDVGHDKLFNDLIVGAEMDTLAGDGPGDDSLDDPFTPAMQQAWYRLQATIWRDGVPANFIDTPLPRWLETAYEDMLRGLLAPDRVPSLTADIDSSGLIARVTRHTEAAGYDIAGESLNELVPFIRNAAANGWWLMGTEWT